MIGVKMKTKPCPGRVSSNGAMAKMKEVEKGYTREEFGFLVGIFLLYKARPTENLCWWVSVRIRESTVALPKSNTSEELKPLKTKSMAHVELKSKRIERRIDGRWCVCLCLIMSLAENKQRGVSCIGK